METKESYLPGDDMVNLLEPDNVEAVDELQYMGKLGKFVLMLLEKAKAENKPLYVEGFGEQTFTVSYNGDRVDFETRASIDSGDAPIEHAHYATLMENFKKPWVKEVMDSMQDEDWLERIPLSFTQFCREVGKETLDLIDLQEQYPNLTFSDMLRIIGEETGPLNQYFTYETAPGRECFAMNFADPAMEQKFLDDDPEFKQIFEPIVKEFIPKVHAKLDALNKEKAA